VLKPELLSKWDFEEIPRWQQNAKLFSDYSYPLLISFAELALANEKK